MYMLFYSLVFILIGGGGLPAEGVGPDEAPDFPEIEAPDFPEIPGCSPGGKRALDKQTRYSAF